jgi:glycosyltransferase involved in cell wall biosynthesis
LKIVLLATDAYGGHGGIALFNRDLAGALSRRHEVIVVPRVVPNPPRDVPARVVFHPEAARSEAAYTAAVGRVLAGRPDLVICGHVNLLPVACALGTRPLLLIYGIEAWRQPKNPATRLLLRRCRGVVAISEITRRRFVAWSRYRGPMHLLPNAIHLEKYGIRPPRPDLVRRYGLEGRRVILTVGRLAGAERYKGFDEVLDVLPDLPPDVSYVIAGGGNDAPRLQKRVSDLQLAGRVAFTGMFLEDEKVDLYNLAHVYAMPSRGEGFGYVFLEALASGVPAVGSRYDGGREALRDGELGLLVDPSNPTEVRLAIAELLESGERRVPAGIEYFSFENFASRAETIIEQALP